MATFQCFSKTLFKKRIWGEAVYFLKMFGGLKNMNLLIGLFSLKCYKHTDSEPSGSGTEARKYADGEPAIFDNPQ